MGKDILRQDEDTVALGDLQGDIITADLSQLSPQTRLDSDLSDTTSDNEILDSDLDEVEYEDFDDEDFDDEDFDDDEISTIDSDIVKPKPRVTTLDDIDDIIEDDILSESDRIKQIMEKNVNLPPCFLNKKLDEKLKNIMTGVTIPFVLISIGFSLFNIGRIRHALSFLFLSLGLGVMGIFYALRYMNTTKCTCPVCKSQSRNIIQFSILWGVLALGFLGAFIYFVITGNNVI